MTRREMKRRIQNAMYTFTLKLVFVYPFKLLYYIIVGLYYLLKWISDTVTEAIDRRRYNKTKYQE